MKQPVVLFASMCLCVSGAMQAQNSQPNPPKAYIVSDAHWIHNGTGIFKQPFKNMYGIR